MQCKGLGACQLPAHSTATCRSRHTQLLARPLQQKIAARQQSHEPLGWTVQSVSEKVDRATLLLPPLISLEAFWASSAQAVEEAAGTAETAAQSQPFLNSAEILLISLPPLLYGVFSLYRSQVNPQAKLSDFLSIVAAAVIIGNIVSVLVFKVRIY